jgi:glucose-1-phosphate thymidylyltransferase
MPAAGHAVRLAPLAASKEILPLGEVDVPGGGRRPWRVCEHLLGALRLAGCARAYVLMRPEKRDIAVVLGDGSGFGLPLAYVPVERSASVPETVDHAYALVREAEVALGFPDVLAEPAAGLREVVERRRATGADLALGLFPTDRPEKADMVELDERGRVRRIEIKPRATALRFTWLYAVWGQRFTELLHDAVARHVAPERELQLSDVIERARREGLRVEAVTFPEGSHLDIGTPEDLARARRGGAWHRARLTR